MSRNAEFAKAVKLVFEADGTAFTPFNETLDSFVCMGKLYVVRYYAQDDAPFHLLKNAHQHAYYEAYHAKLAPVIVLNCAAARREQMLLEREFGKVEYIDRDYLLDLAAAHGIAIYEAVKVFTDRRV